MYCESEKKEASTFDDCAEEDAVNFSRYFYTNLYLAITDDRLSTFSRSKERRSQGSFCFSLVYIRFYFLFNCRRFVASLALVVFRFFFSLGRII